MWPRIRVIKKKKWTYGWLLMACAHKTHISKNVPLRLRGERDPSSTWKPSQKARCWFLRTKTVTYLPTSSTTGAGHSKKVFSTPAGFSSVWGKSSSLQRKAGRSVGAAANASRGDLLTVKVSLILKLQSTWLMSLAWRKPFPRTTTWKVSGYKTHAILHFKSK